jgi:hypothetical protein
MVNCLIALSLTCMRACVRAGVGQPIKYFLFNQESFLNSMRACVRAGLGQPRAC